MAGEWSAESFVAGHPGLDFLNTAGGRDKTRDLDRLVRFTDAVTWAAAAGLVDGAEAAELTRLAGEDPKAAAGALGELRERREVLHAFLLAAVGGEPVPPTVRRRVEGDVRSAYRHATLDEDLDGPDGWSVRLDDVGTALIGHRVALTVGALLAGERRGQIRVCGRCSWLFLDPSPTRRRRWCSMASCGNRAKAQRHHQRGRPEISDRAGG